MMKRMMILLLALVMLLAGCAASTSDYDIPDDREDETIQATPEEPTAEPTEATEAPTAPAWEGYEVTYEYLISKEGQEFCVLTGIDPAGNTAWTYISESYDMAQLERLSDIGRFQDRYYFVEDGSVVALEVCTGDVLWINDDFGGGYSMEKSAMIDDDGCVYLCGFFGPDFFAVDAAGNTLQKIECLDPDYYWAYRLEQVDQQIEVHLSGGPEGDVGDPGYIVSVEIDWPPHAEPER